MRRRQEHGEARATTRRRRARRLTGCIALTVMVIGAGHGVGAGRPAAADTGGPPNVLVLVSDDQSWSTFSRALMPNVFSQLVDKGVLFDHAYVNTSLCCPSRSQILTGLYEHHTWVDHNNVMLTRPTMVQAVHDLGYRTMLAGKYLNSEPCSPQPQFDEWDCTSVPPSSYTLVNPYMNVNGKWKHLHGYTTDILAGRVNSFIDSSVADGKPFFAMYTPTSPHLPANDPRYSGLSVPKWRPPSYDEDTQNDGKPGYMQRGPLTAAEQARFDHEHAVMTRAVPALDGSIETILQHLADTGLEQNTLVLYISDNGFLYGEHRRQGKSVPYEESVRVPFIVRYPELVPESEPFTTSALVENVDIASTVADALGFHWGADGTSLVPILTKQQQTVRDEVLIEHCTGPSPPCRYPDDGDLYVTPFWGLISERYADLYSFIQYSTGELELYDLSTDPYELVNLAGDPGYTVVQAALTSDLANLRSPPVPDTTIVTGPRASIASRVATFTYFSQSRLATFSCRLDWNGTPGSWSACNGGSTTLGGLVDGDYVFEVLATDENGVSDPTPDSRAFSISSTGPAVTIDSGPSAHTQNRTASYQFSSPVGGVTFRCSLTALGAPPFWTSCKGGAPRVYGPLADGWWDFQVAARLPNGTITNPPAEWLTHVDNAGPVMTFDLVPIFPFSFTSTSSRVPSGPFAFHSDEPVDGPVTCSLDGGAAFDCPTLTGNVSGLTDGAHTFTVTASDVLGNVGETTFAWTVDTTKPNVSIDEGPANITNSTAAIFTLSSDEPGHFSCAKDGGKLAKCGSTVAYTRLADGQHVFTAEATDLVGNVSALAVWSWTVDSTAPGVAILSGPPPTTQDTTADFAFTASEAPVTFSCSLDGMAPTPCDSGVTYSGLLAGGHTFALSAADAAGNTGPQSYWYWTVETIQ